MHREVCFRGYKALGSWTAMVRAWFLRALLCEKKGQSQSTNLLTHITTHHAEPGTVYVIIYIIYMVRCFLPERGAYFIYQPFAGKVQPTSTNLYTILLDIWCLLTVKLFFFFRSQVLDCFYCLRQDTNRRPLPYIVSGGRPDSPPSMANFLLIDLLIDLLMYLLLIYLFLDLFVDLFLNLLIYLVY